MMVQIAAMRRSRAALVLVCLGSLGCGGASQAPAPVATAEAPLAAETTPTPAPEAASPEADTPPAEPEAPARDPDAQRDVRYVVMPEGLKVEVDGVRFMARAEALRTPAGFTVRVTVSATASEARSLLAPKNGPLAFAGSVKRASKAEPESFGDAREGDGDEPLGAGTTVKLVREWPGKGGPRPLGNGDSVELDVGLWGLGTGPGDRRPVKQFARVKASVDHWKGKASIAPPPSLMGK